MNKVKNIIRESSQKVKLIKNKINIISFTRLILFILFLLTVLYSFDKKVFLYLYFGLFFLFSFFLFVFLSEKLKNKLQYQISKNEICISFTNENKRSVNSINIERSKHAFCNDLDIIGDKSLFSKLNQCQTINGSLNLVEKLLNPLLNSADIFNRQDSIKELSNKVEWSFNFLSNLFIKIPKKNSNLIESSWEITYLQSNLLKTTLFVFVLVNIACFTFFLNLNFSLYTLLLVVIPVIFSLTINKIYSKKIQEIYHNIDIKSDEFKKYSLSLDLILQENFESLNNKNLKSKLILKNGSTSLKLINKLSRLLNGFENSKIPIIGVVLNTFFLWDLQFAYRIENLIFKNYDKIKSCLDTVHEFEALISFGLFAYKNSEYTYPILSEKFDVTNISHPLLPKEQIVNNNFTLRSKNNQVVIITGANMTGKSTFLRTIGINLVLAMNGCPVCATSFSFYPIQLFTSMRTNDSLADGSSYFNAEIKRLKLLIDKLDDNQPQFVILDEILKGTNSEDKLKGSKLFLEKIIKMKTQVSCVIATHDLDLTKMEHEYPNNIENYCFELQNINDELEADYKLQKGITKSMNAIRLMRKYKIIN